jgi:alpha-glucuronidase
MELDGCQVVQVTPWETASGGKAVECLNGRPRCSARFDYHGPPGWYDLIVEYFDQNNGISTFSLYVGDQLVDEWKADDHLPSRKPDGSSATRRVIHGLALRPGDQIRIEGSPDGQEYAPLDYIEIVNSEKHREANQHRSRNNDSP